ncbi:hypothetical protein ACWDNI_02040 [Nocardia niigatensis]
MELLRRFTDEQYRYALESWNWIGLEGKYPMFTSPFGDVFLGAEDGVWWLDTFYGKLSYLWGSVEECEAELQTRDGQQLYLRADLAVATAAHGLTPNESQIYDLTHPAVLGGDPQIGNVQVMDFVTALGMAGQIHDQVRFIAEGAQINIAVPGPEPRRGWRRWFGRD